PFRLVIALQLVAEPSRFYPDDRIDTRVERVHAIENLDPEQVLFELVFLAGERLLNNEGEKAADARRSREGLAGEDAIQLSADGTRLNGFLSCRRPRISFHTVT